MIGATYFGEITELGSRAVWYSDEEYDDDDDEAGNEVEARKSRSPIKPQTLTDHESIRANLKLRFERLLPSPNLKFRDCIISLSSSAHYKNFKTSDPSLLLIGQFGKSGRVFVSPLRTETGQIDTNQCSLWIMFDAGDQLIVGQEVAYFVEALRGQLFNELALDPSSPIIILSKQFSNSEHLEYLSNHMHHPQLVLPYTGRPMVPPSLVKNQFESALFEQLTLTLKLAYVVCLPDPKNFWFDKNLCWPTISNQIIEHQLNDDNLEKTLIFTWIILRCQSECKETNSHFFLLYCSALSLLFSIKELTPKC